jgi:threonine dehydrogenase-like Zn-dependent dehydrogenase
MQPLLAQIEQGKIDTASIITHRVPLAEAPQAYDVFCNKEDECIKVVMRP